MIDIFVVAGNRQQFENLCASAQEWWDSELKNHQVHYVEDYQQLDVDSPCRVFVYGTYLRRLDWPVIEYVIKERGHRMLVIR